MNGFSEIIDGRVTTRPTQASWDKQATQPITTQRLAQSHEWFAGFKT